ncbi:hypothetical protein [Tenacibaculum sp. 190524A02b]|uniref:STAS domain-containing protein n=1 Tax=Tenacibaculum vairaonense TaxID=3137860 RepID=A0ABP1FA37_9FLAO
MDFKVSSINNQFILSGVIQAQNFKKVKKGITSLLKKYHTIILDINNVSKMDAYSVNSIINIFEKTSNTNKDISIKGFGAKDIYDELIQKNIV